MYKLSYFLKISSKGILHNFLYAERINTQILIEWKDIVEIKKIGWIFTKNICIYYKDNFENKIRKQKIEIKNSECSCDEIYDVLITKWTKYKKAIE